MSVRTDWLRSSYGYDLDPARIAQEPVTPRDSSRLLVYDRSRRDIAHTVFRNITDFLRSGDLLVVNTTRVLPARLLPRRAGTGGNAEVLLLRALGPETWEAMVKPGKRLRPGSVLEFDDGTHVEVGERLPDGTRVVRFSRSVDIGWLGTFGSMPLPPYIRRPAEAKDTETYQTVFAEVPGAVAAPTAGLHFTTELLDQIERLGVKRVPVLLHVGPGTFQPVREDDVRKHRMHAEFYEISAKTLACIRDTREAGGRVIAVGTTSVRALETVAANGQHESDQDVSGWTEAFIYPPYRMQMVDGIVTNFHLPESTLLMLVSAFAGREETLRLYRIAVEEGYRFYSYGDAMFIY